MYWSMMVLENVRDLKMEITIAKLGCIDLQFDLGLHLLQRTTIKPWLRVNSHTRCSIRNKGLSEGAYRTEDINIIGVCRLRTLHCKSSNLFIF